MPEIQKDLVLSPNEYAYVLDETKGNVACNVGPQCICPILESKLQLKEL